MSKTDNKKGKCKHCGQIHDTCDCKRPACDKKPNEK